MEKCRPKLVSDQLSGSVTTPINYDVWIENLPAKDRVDNGGEILALRWLQENAKNRGLVRALLMPRKDDTGD